MAKGQCSATWFLVVTGFLEAWTQQHQQLKLFPTQGLRCLPSSSFLSFQHWKGETLHWSDPLREWKWGREWFSYNCHCLTHACVLSGWYWWSKETGLLHECPINWQRWQDCLFFQHERFVQSSAHSCSELEESRWFLVTTGFLEAPGGFGTKALPNTRSEVSAKLKLSQLSTLQTRHSSLIWPFAQMETVERMVLLQLSLADTHKCVLSSRLVVGMSSIAARMSYQLATGARHWTRA